MLCRAFEAINVGGALVPRPDLVFIKQPRPRVCHQVFSACAARIPFFRPFNESLGDRILLDVASDEFELFSGPYSGVVIAILPGRFVLCQERVCLAANDNSSCRA